MTANHFYPHVDRNVSTPGDSASNPSYTVATIGDGANLDAFSRLRVSDSNLLLSTIFDTSERPLYWDATVNGGGAVAHNEDERCVELSVTGGSGGTVNRATKEYFAYRAGQGQLIFATFAMAAAQENLNQFVGYFDALDGIFFSQTGAGGSLKFVVRSSTGGSPVDNAITQDNWNLDTLDGTGPSGHTLDPTKTQILVIDFQWLGVGRVRVGFDLDGVVVYAHEFLHANDTLDKVYMKTPKLPVTYKIEATGAVTGTPTMKQICSTVIREGADEEPGLQTSVHTGAPSGGVSVGTSLQGVLGIRLKSTNIRATLRALDINVLNKDTVTMQWMLVLNPTLTGSPTWLDPGSNSVAEYARGPFPVTVDGNGVPSNAVTLASGFLAGGGQSRGQQVLGNITESIPIVADIAGNPDELWLCAMVASGTGDAHGSISVKEIR